MKYIPDICMQKITYNDIRNYIKEKNFKNSKTRQPYESVLVNYAKIANMIPNESVDQLYTRFIIGKTSSSAKFAKSVIYDFEATRKNGTVSTKTPEELQKEHEEYLKKQAEEKTQEQLRKFQQDVKIALEAKKAREEKEAEEKKRQANKQKRLEARTKNFVSQDFPDYIQKFDYMQNIPQKAREYFPQGSEEKLFNICAQTGKHSIMSGAAGSGKTELVIKYAKENKIPLFKFSCSSDVRMDDLIGTKTISEDGQTIKFQAGMLLKAVLTANKHGKAIILLDEVNTLAEKVQKNINGLADGTGFIDLPMGRIAINEGTQFLICGTMNLSYAGTNPLNPELKDRFTIIDMPKMSDETRHKIYSQYSISKNIENNLIQLSKELDKAQEENQVSGDVVFSTRSQIAFLELYEDLKDNGIESPISEALNVTLVSKFDDQEDKRFIKSLISRVFT